MANSLTFTTPAGENITFTLSAQADGTTVLYSQDFTTAVTASIYLKVFETVDSANPITDYSSLSEGSMYDIEAYSDAGFTTPIDITSWSGTNVTFLSFDFVADRRPLFIAGYATTNQANEQITFGTGNSSDKRKTPLTSASDADFLDPTKNGRIDWIDGDVAGAIGFGLERMNFSNIAGWTSLSGSNSDWPALNGNNQPHYPSNPYTGLSLTEAEIMANPLTNVGSVMWDTPFTVDGYSNSDPGKSGDTTPGDQKKSWKAAVQYTKDLVETEGGTPEVIAYCGYRPLWTDKTQVAFDKTLLGYCKTSTGNIPSGQWTGIGADSPGWSPEPGWDGVGATSSSSESFSAWFDEEAAGLYSLGFNSIGLDTGARVWKNSGGMSKGANGCEFTNDYDVFTGNDRLIELFNDYGMKAYYESVPLDRWTHMSSYDASKLTPMVGADAAAYEKAAFWAFFGSWWGYVGDGGYNEFNGADSSMPASGGSVWNPTLGDGTATVGDPSLSGARVLGSNTEVHAVFQWRGAAVNYILDTYDWVTLQQIMYDYHTAGLIVSAGANAQSDYAGVTASQFYAFVMDLSKGEITSRPEQPPAGPYWDLDFTSMAVASGVLDDSTTTDFGVSGGRVFENYGVQATNGPTWGLQTSTGSNGWYSDTHISKSANGNTTWRDSFVTDLGSPPSGGWVMEGKIARGAQGSLNSIFGFVVNGGDRADGDFTVIGINPKAGTNTSNVRVFTNDSESNPLSEDLFPGDLAANTEAHLFLRLTYDGADYTLEGWVGDDDTGTQFCDQSIGGSLVTDHGNNFGWFAPAGNTNGRGISLFNFKMAPPGVGPSAAFKATGAMPASGTIASPTLDPAVSGLSEIRLSSGFPANCGLIFSGQSARDAWWSGITEGAGTWTLTVDGSSYTASPGWTANLNQSGTTNRVYFNFDSISGLFPITEGSSFELKLEV